MASLDGYSELPHPVFVLLYEQKNITHELSAFVTQVAYTDYLQGQSDEIAITLEDMDQRWLFSWYPTKGDRLTLSLGYQGQSLLNCGQFQIDEIEIQFSPSTVQIKALSTGTQKALRTRQGVAYENTTLAAITARIAARHQLRVVGTIRELAIDRATQFKETDLGFLTRLANEYGYRFKVVGSQLVFTEYDALTQVASITSIGRKQLISGTLRDKVHLIYGASNNQYHNPKEKRLISFDASKQPDTEPSSDTLNINVRSSSPAMAEVKSKAALKKANAEQTTGNLKLIGHTKLVAGCVITLTECGKLDGRYLIESAHHQIERDAGYTTDIEIKRVGKNAKAPKSKLTTYDVKDGSIIQKKGK